MTIRVMVRGGGDLASGIILRLFRCGFQVFVTEIAVPLAVRRMVTFARAVYEDPVDVEGVSTKRVEKPEDMERAFSEGWIPVLIDPAANSLNWIKPDVLVDARMTKKSPDHGIGETGLMIGIGPGFTAGVDCDALIETKRGPFLGRVYWNGTADPDTGLPEPVGKHQGDRVLRSPESGKLVTYTQIGSVVHTDEVIATVDGSPVKAAFDGVLRGLLQDGVFVPKNMKIGDLDPRMDERLCWQVSDKALAIGGGVLEAILSKPEFRQKLSGQS
jgi:xanthine dehydrogenase accessory factor